MRRTTQDRHEGGRPERTGIGGRRGQASRGGREAQYRGRHDPDIWQMRNRRPAYKRGTNTAA